MRKLQAPDSRKQSSTTQPSYLYKLISVQPSHCIRSSAVTNTRPMPS